MVPFTSGVTLREEYLKGLLRFLGVISDWSLFELCSGFELNSQVSKTLGYLCSRTPKLLVAVHSVRFVT